MKIAFDIDKSNKNTQERDLPFDKAAEFDWETAIVLEDIRKTYSEKRFIATGYLDARVHIICFTPIKNGVRIISFRKANKREVKRYEKVINE